MRESPRHPGPQPVPDDVRKPHAEEDLDVWTTLAIVLEKRRLVVKVSAALFALAALMLFLGAGRRFYTSTGSFFPQQTQSANAGLAGIAERFGVEVSGTSSSQGPEFYAQLVQSRRILTDLVRKVHVPAEQPGQPPLTLSEVLLEKPLETPAATEAATVDLVRKQLLSVNVARGTDVVSFSIKAPSPALARQMADTLIGLVKTFNVVTRQSQASEERRFAEGRLAEMQKDLAGTEATLQAFLEKNRQYDNSPQLQFEHDRLQRAVEMQQDVLTSLAQSAEQAKIDEVRSTPLITVMEAPEVPVRPDPRGLFNKLVFAALFALFGGVLFGLVHARLRPEEPASRGYARAERAYQQMKGEIRAVFARRRPAATAAIEDRAAGD